MSTSDNEEFFEERKAQSLIKAQIVSKYFWVWAKIMAERTDELIYMDFFSGPGMYTDGSKSTPLLIVEGALRDKKIYSKIEFLFNDENFDYINQLQIEIEQLSDYDKLVNPPIYLNKDVSDIVASDVYPGGKAKPTLLFVDPFGYNGLNPKFFNVLKHYGSDIIFFFNYKRINMAISNRVFINNMKQLFGETIYNQIKDTFNDKNLSPVKREEIITEAISKKIQSVDQSIIAPLHYRFRSQTGRRTTHHLFFATKSVAGYTAMKDIMAKLSSTIEQGVATMEYNPADERQPRLLLDFSIPQLKKELLRYYAGKTLTVKDAFYGHHIGKPYVEKNYKQALRELEAGDRIIVNPVKDLRRHIKGVVTMADSVLITFPSY